MKSAFSQILILASISVAGCATEMTMNLNELKTNDGQNYYPQGTVLNSCAIRGKKDVTVTMNGIQIKACEITRSYSKLEPSTTAIYEIECSKVHESKAMTCK